MMILIELPLAEVVTSVVFPDDGPPYLLLAGPEVQVHLVPSGSVVDDVVAAQMLGEAAEAFRVWLEG